MGVLGSIPWDKVTGSQTLLLLQVDIRLLTVEFSHSDSDRIRNIMETAGYTLLFTVGEDMVFQK